MASYFEIIIIFEMIIHTCTSKNLLNNKVINYNNKMIIIINDKNRYTVIIMVVSFRGD